MFYCCNTVLCHPLFFVCFLYIIFMLFFEGFFYVINLQPIFSETLQQISFNSSCYTFPYLVFKLRFYEIYQRRLTSATHINKYVASVLCARCEYSRICFEVQCIPTRKKRLVINLLSTFIYLFI